VDIRSLFSATRVRFMLHQLVLVFVLGSGTTRLITPVGIATEVKTLRQIRHNNCCQGCSTIFRA